jgi:ribosomal protein S18 acetylase RimI-like enzyme
MLRAATFADLEFIRQILREEAARGSFDAELAHDTPEARLFFANLGDALRFGYLKVHDAKGELAGEVHVAAYVYSEKDGTPPIGFGLFKALEGPGFELWLTGIAADRRGRGHGHNMIAQLMETPAGQLACLVRCNRRSATADSAVRFFRDFGFAPCRETAETFWLVNSKASSELVAKVSESAIRPA